MWRDATTLGAPLPRPATSPRSSGASSTFPVRRWRIPTFPVRRRPLHLPGGDGGRLFTSPRRSASPRARWHSQPVGTAAAGRARLQITNQWRMAVTSTAAPSPAVRGEELRWGLWCRPLLAPARRNWEHRAPIGRAAVLADRHR